MSESTKEKRTYCMDTSALISMWIERYPIMHFPSFWDKDVDSLCREGRMKICFAVRRELEESKESKLLEWIDGHNHESSVLLPESQDEVDEAARIVNINNWYKQKEGEPSIPPTAIVEADPYLMATAKLYDYVVVTEEKLEASLKRPGRKKTRQIPDVCDAIEVDWCRPLALIQGEEWRYR